MFGGTRQLTIAIITRTCQDLDLICKKIRDIRKHCAAGTLAEYINSTPPKYHYKKLPFITSDDATALQFFEPDNTWARMLLEEHDIIRLPEDITNKIDYIKTAERYCKACLYKYKLTKGETYDNHKQFTRSS